MLSSSPAVKSIASASVLELAFASSDNGAAVVFFMSEAEAFPPFFAGGDVFGFFAFTAPGSFFTAGSEALGAAFRALGTAIFLPTAAPFEFFTEEGVEVFDAAALAFVFLIGIAGFVEVALRPAFLGVVVGVGREVLRREVLPSVLFPVARLATPPFCNARGSSSLSRSSSPA